jgi:hypothetical protein
MSTRPRDYCKDCWQVEEDLDIAHSKKPRPIAKDSGGRCATHWRMEKARRKAANHERHVQNTYGLQPGDYDRLYTHQTGVCAICKRATGATRKLCVDHDHATGKVRGLLCRPCNDMLGHARDSDMFFYRAAGYLQRPPASEVLTDE